MDRTVVGKCCGTYILKVLQMDPPSSPLCYGWYHEKNTLLPFEKNLFPIRFSHFVVISPSALHVSHIFPPLPGYPKRYNQRYKHLYRQNSSIPKKALWIRRFYLQEQLPRRVSCVCKQLTGGRAMREESPGATASSCSAH